MAKGKRSRRRLKNKSEDYEQKYCSCGRPISQNCFSSEKMGGKCGRCYRSDVKEHVKRRSSKDRARERKSQRSYKSFTRQF